MTPARPEPDADDTRRRVVDALSRYGRDSARLAHAFAAGHDLQVSDLQAIIAIMTAEQQGTPLTPGTLKAHLGLSSAGTSYVLDRLEKAGHVRRTRDHPSDSRVVYLRHTASGRQTASTFFGPLADRTHDVMAGFDPAELEVVARFVDAAATSVHEYLDELGGG